MPGPLMKLLITPVDFSCNMACRYCYNGSFRKPSTVPIETISMGTLYRIFDQIPPLLQGNHLFVIWHGGEPLLAGEDFYREALQVQKKASAGRYAITNCMQTNGTLVDEAWADLLAELKIGPSVSVDGPAHLNDNVRTYLNGAPTYGDIMRGYRLLRSRDLNAGMLMVISQKNVKEAKAIWKWILQEKIPHLDFLPCIEPELWRRHQQQYGLSPQEVAAFFTEMFDLWLDHGDPAINIRTFRDAVKGQLGGKVNICSWKAGCLQHISFDAAGNVYPCARYHSYPETRLGNIQEITFPEILKTKKADWVRQGIADGQERCAPCKWNSICGSGCPFLKYALHGSWNAQYIHCQPRQALFSHVRERIFQ